MTNILVSEKVKEASVNMHPWAVRLSWLENAYSRPILFGWAILPSFFVFDEGSLVGLCMQTL